MAADTYHHGNLRQALLEHAVELARTGGPDAVVLRDVQRMAGVSNSAAYRHYSDRGALLAAVTEYAESKLADDTRQIDWPRCGAVNGNHLITFCGQ